MSSEYTLPAVPGYPFAVIAIVPATDDRPNAVCVLGTFTDLTSAKAHIDLVKQSTVRFDLGIAECGKWVVVPPTDDLVQDIKYQNKYIDDLMTGYFDQQAAAKKHFDERKQHMIEEKTSAIAEVVEEPSENDDGTEPAN